MSEYEVHFWNDGELDIRKFGNEEDALLDIRDIVRERVLADMREEFNDVRLFHEGTELHWTMEIVRV